MRKWMSDRLKRRKKPGEGSNKEATKAPEPLQPRFYDIEPRRRPLAFPLNPSQTRESRFEGESQAA